MPAIPAWATTMSSPENSSRPCSQRLGQLGRITDVGLRSHYPPSGLLDQVRGLLEVLGPGHGIADGGEVLTDVDRDDVGSLFGQSYRMAATLPTTGSGDESDFALNASHETSFHRCCEMGLSERTVMQHWRLVLTPRRPHPASAKSAILARCGVVRVANLMRDDRVNYLA